METVLMTDDEVLEATRKLRVGYALKRVIRYGAQRDPALHAESVAEHVFALIYLAHYFLRREEVGPMLDAERLHTILLFHDFGEIEDGDIPYHLKTSADEEKERAAAKRIFDSLPPEMQPLARDAWEKYESRETLEGKFAYAIDKIEPLFELYDPVNELTMKRLRFTYAMNMGKKYDATRDYPVMRRFIDVISNDMHSRGVFWEA